jgi:hypothetical protein
MSAVPAGTAPTDGAPTDGATFDTASTAAAPSTKRRRRARRRRIYRRVALVMSIPLAVVGWSYVHALTGPGSDSLGARSVEWMRDHHLGGAVDAFERRWYDHHQAKVGGAPSVTAAVPQLAATAAPSAVATSTTTALAVPAPATTVAVPMTRPPTTPASSAETTTTVGAVASPPSSKPDGGSATPAAPLPPPAPLHTPAATPIADEGVWAPIGPTSGGVAAAYGTLIRPDDVHTSILDAVVWIDPHVLRFRQYPGANLPGSPWDRPDHVEAEQQSQLVAAFAGGFRLQDSHGGMILGGTQLAPMRTGAATLTISADGVPNIGMWGRDVDASTPIDSARQNLDLIVDGGAPVPQLLQDPNRAWGFTGPANKSAVWRSGAGITADGALVWVGGPGLTIEALADTLVRAGAIRGMQLDINQQWVQLNTYTTAADGTVSGTRILSGMEHTGDRWLTVDTRDFIAVFVRRT